MTLLFELATWHALAKLRMHTETTLNFMDTSTTRLGQQLRRFVSQTCTAFVTWDLPQEEAARGRRKAAMAAKDPNKPPPKRNPPKQWYLNLSTFKLHSLGDYVNSIWLYGTTDNFTTQIVSHLFQVFEISVNWSVGWTWTSACQTVLPTCSQDSFCKRDCETSAPRTVIVQDEPKGS